jgi:hypothetical protein
MIIIIALLLDLLLEEIRVERTWGSRASRAYMNVLSRGHVHDDTGLEGLFQGYYPICFSTVPRVMSGLRNETAAMMVSRGVNKNASRGVPEMTRTPDVGTKWLRNNWSGPPTNRI